MPVLILDSCCCCVNLRTGCLIIGYLQLVEEFLISLLVLVLLAGGHYKAETGNQKVAAILKERFSFIGMGTGMLVMGIILLLVLALRIVFTITLLVGLAKNKRGHVRAYLISFAVCLALGVILFCAGLATSQPITGENVISNIFSLMLNTYFFLVIYSHYHKMDDANSGPVTYFS